MHSIAKELMVNFSDTIKYKKVSYVIDLDTA